MNLPQLLEKKQKEVVRYITDVAPRKIGKMAIDHIGKAFEEEGFTDQSFQPWKEVKRRLPENLKKGKRGKPLKRQLAYNRNKILKGREGNLRRSFRYVATPEQIEIKSDVEYAATHNYGLKQSGVNKNGKNYRIDIPKRQFITPYIPQHLENKLIDTIEKDLTKILQP